MSDRHRKAFEAMVAAGVAHARKQGNTHVTEQQVRRELSNIAQTAERKAAMAKRTPFSRSVPESETKKYFVMDGKGGSEEVDAQEFREADGANWDDVRKDKEKSFQFDCGKKS